MCTPHQKPPFDCHNAAAVMRGYANWSTCLHCSCCPAEFQQMSEYAERVRQLNQTREVCQIDGAR